MTRRRNRHLAARSGPSRTRNDTTRPLSTATAAPYAPRVFGRRSRARFARERRAGIIAHLGRPLSYPEEILIARVVALEWDLRRQDARLDAGEDLSPHALRARLAAENRLRLDLVAIGLRPGAERPLSPDEALAAIHSRFARSEP